MGSNFLLDWGSINQEFAAGNIGMYTRAPTSTPRSCATSGSTRESTA